MPQLTPADTTEVLQPWEVPYPKESRSAFHAFNHYLASGYLYGNARSRNRAWLEHRDQCLNGGGTTKTSRADTAPRQWGGWSSQFEWLKRSQDYDVHLHREEQRARIRDIHEAHARHRKIAIAGQAKLAERLKNLRADRIPAHAIAPLLKVLTDLELRGLGEATEISQIVGDEDRPVPFTFKFAESPAIPEPLDTLPESSAVPELDGETDAE